MIQASRCTDTKRNGERIASARLPGRWDGSEKVVGEVDCEWRVMDLGGGKEGGMLAGFYEARRE